MTIQQAPRGKVARRHLSAAAALVLTALATPSLAATGTEARPDQALYAPPMSLSTDHDASLAVIDQGAARAVTPDAPAGDDAEAVPDAAAPPAGLRVEIMLRRIFDEAQARQPTLQPRQEDDDFNPPLAVEQSETLDNPRGVVEAEAAAQPPGFGADDLLRYRQQMYRTDI